MVTLDPFGLAKEYWPSLRLYKEQVEILYSCQQVTGNDETWVPAANMMGVGPLSV